MQASYHSPLEGESDKVSPPSSRWGANAASRKCSPQSIRREGATRRLSGALGTLLNFRENS